MVNSENIEVLTEKYMNFKGPYLTSLESPLNSEEKVLEKDLEEIKSWDKKKIQKMFEEYFRENRRFLSFDERVSLFLIDYPVFWGVFVFGILGCLYGIFSVFRGILGERKRGRKFESFLEKQKMLKKDLKGEEKLKKDLKENLVTKKEKIE